MAEEIPGGTVRRPVRILKKIKKNRKSTKLKRLKVSRPPEKQPVYQEGAFAGAYEGYVQAPVQLVKHRELRCPLGLERSPQNIGEILSALDLPRNKVSTHLYLASLAAQVGGTSLEGNVQILPMIKEVFGEKYGHQEPFSMYFEKRRGLKEDLRTKLSCTAECLSCTLAGSKKIAAAIKMIRDMVAVTV